MGMHKANSEGAKKASRRFGETTDEGRVVTALFESAGKPGAFQTLREEGRGLEQDCRKRNEERCCNLLRPLNLICQTSVKTFFHAFTTLADHHHLESSGRGGADSALFAAFD